MIASLQEIGCASLPLESLPALASLRDLPGVTVALLDSRAWVAWEPGDERVLRAVLPAHGVELYVQRDDQWYRLGMRMPAFDYPEDADFRPLSQVLTPAPVQPIAPGPRRYQPVTLKLKPNPRPRPTTALICSADDLARWADSISAVRLATFRAAINEERILLLGSSLPALPGARFWGGSVLAPLGFQPDPDLPPPVICAALGLQDEELLLLSAGGSEVIPLFACQPLTRAQVRLAEEAAS